MGLQIGIVGLPNVGKSTLFQALTRKSVLIANYPFATIDPSVGVVAVPDERLQKLSIFSHSAKTIPASIEFVDIAGLVKGASEGEGLGNQFLTHIRETDAILQVVRIFEDGDIHHVAGAIDPVGDIGVINLELALADLQTVEKRIQSIGREVKRGDKEAVAEDAALRKIETGLKEGKRARSVLLTDEEKAKIKQLGLISMKPILYVLNKKHGGQNLDELKDARYQKLLEFLKSEGAEYVVVDAKIQDELAAFEGEERVMMRSEMGVTSDGVDDLIRGAYHLLGLETYFTTGEDETRAWTIKVGSTAPEAGTAIHTDFKDKFVRAEIIHWKTLLDAGSFATAREKGLVRTEGKEYIVKDGDVIEFKI
jgi:GTP-binding protein YchF